MKQAYESRRFRRDISDLIDRLNDVVDDYVGQGFRLTVRQLYYQCIALDLFPDTWIDAKFNAREGLAPDTKNTVKNYKKLAVIINDAKMAGLMDWEAIEDRTRSFVRQTRWQSGEHILKAAAQGFHMDMWVGQEYRPFCLVEKEALAGVLEPVCHRYDIPLLAARGYPSGTVLREFAQSDVISCVDAGQTPVILHLGDHDPSGIDMSRDLRERIATFMTGQVGNDLRHDEFQRLALNMPQIRALNPPPNPAKSTDSRFEDYQAKYGTDSWELDALSPKYLDKLVSDAADNLISHPKNWKDRLAEIENIKKRIIKASANFK